PVTLLQLAEGRAAREMFLLYFGLKTTPLHPDQVAATGEQVLDAVARLSGALGYAPLSLAEQAAAAGRPIRLLPLGGVRATRANVANGTYPLSRPLNLVTRASPPEFAADLVDFALSSEVLALLDRFGFVPPPPAGAPMTLSLPGKTR